MMTLVVKKGPEGFTWTTKKSTAVMAMIVRKTLDAKKIMMTHRVSPPYIIIVTITLRTMMIMKIMVLVIHTVEETIMINEIITILMMTLLM